ncbi:MAG: hypothetical protein GX154_08550 [Clostridiales bacterium]|jgi:hypothetical protein|nr:hypothetical protein [Clostridiales bacterium]
MGIRGTIILIAALLTIISSIFTGDYSGFRQAIGVIVLICIIIAVSAVLKRDE